MNKDIFTALIGGNETETFGLIEKFYCTVTH